MSEYLEKEWKENYLNKKKYAMDTNAGKFDRVHNDRG